MTRYPSEQIITCVRFTVTILFALWMADRYDGEDILRLICTAQMVFVVLTLLYCVLFPGTIFFPRTGRTRLYRISAHQEQRGSGAFRWHPVPDSVVQTAARTAGDPQRWELMLFVVQGMMLFLCNAKGALFCVAIPAAYLLFVEGRNDPEWRLPLGLVYVVGSVGFLIAALTILPLMEPLLSAIGKDATLTGRTPLWRQIILVMTNSHTFTGYGFGMFWRDRQAVALLHSVPQQLLYGYDDHRCAQCAAGILAQCGSVRLGIVFYCALGLVSADAEAGTSKLYFLRGIYALVHGHGLDGTLHVHL